MSSGPVVDLFLFSYRSMGHTCMLAMQCMCRASERAGVTIRLRPYGNAMIHLSRNMAISNLSPDATHALFLDDDMLPKPNALLELLAADKPVISALCTTRGEPITVVGKYYDPETDGFAQIHRVPLDKTVEGSLAPGAAFLLVKKEVIDQVIDYYLSAQDWLVENRRALDRLKVRSENREHERKRIEGERRKNFENDRAVRVFCHPVNEHERELGEDIAFARKLLHLGIPVCIAGATQVGHMGEHPYSVWDIVNQETEPHDGI